MSRRRHCLRSILRQFFSTAVFSIAFVILFLISLLSFYTPSFVDPNHSKPLVFRDIQESYSDNRISFQIPGDGGRSKYGLWRSKIAGYFVGCSNASKKFETEINTHSDRLLAIATSGGLNQQRTGVIDAVVAARILNATLIVPILDQKSFWKDSSNFSEIFDVNWFISYLSKDVKILKELPKKGGKVVKNPYRMRVPRKCNPRCYEKRVMPVLLKKHAVQLGKFDYRLANRLPPDLQKLRCRVNYHALRFTRSIEKMGNILIRRMRGKSKHFIALHLRFEPDMLAFSGCYYGGGEKERRELGAIRRRWKTLHISNPEKERRHGKCPLTPEEVGLMLRGLGYGHQVHIYVASGEVYGGEETLAPLKSLFPNFHTKETLARMDELKPFSSFSSRMAALDFIACDESDVFVTNNNGNMAKILAGRRRYFGHKRTIRPNAKKLYSLFQNRSNLTWEAFATKVQSCQNGFMGEPNEVRPGRGEFHENPSTCICESPESKLNAGTRYQSKVNNSARKEGFGKNYSEPIYNSGYREDDEQESPEAEDEGNSRFNGTESDYDTFNRGDDPELEEMFSD